MKYGLVNWLQIGVGLILFTNVGATSPFTLILRTINILQGAWTFGKTIFPFASVERTIRKNIYSQAILAITFNAFTFFSTPFFPAKGF